jgi:hypothetical protein
MNRKLLCSILLGSVGFLAYASAQEAKDKRHKPKAQPSPAVATPAPGQRLHPVAKATEAKNGKKTGAKANAPPFKVATPPPGARTTPQ